ncbi:hypothetical protein NUU61_000783 [Penicillium alfredii]|uniref:Uncharacterized protein n=1 Tax=Penicillium alfredii TaxID=1506179 RepID=A0A9W9GAP6_9EURO|nr:uncharacterized protein NUU61_000783 [Penicillium alfredii]KAJ5115024.1 hypothetical protein NUU61_000783 [Penicillium alfredii]
MSPAVQHPQSASTVFLDQPPSCLEFCPENPNYIVVGTYLLSETKTEDGGIQQAKTGSLQLWRLDPDNKTLSLIQRIALSYAVFDLHFHPRHPNTLAIASSVGSIALFKVSSAASAEDSLCPALHPSISHVWTKQVHEDPSIPALFLAWAPQTWFSRAGVDGFAVTFSDSRTAVFGVEGDLDNEEQITEWGTFEARQMIEVWFVALATIPQSLSTTIHDETPEKESQQGVSFMFTGNDFGSLHTRRFEKNHDQQEEEEEEQEDDDSTEEPLAPLLLDHDDRARHHTAGVTAILPSQSRLRVYHATRPGAVLAEQGLGGGVWRLQMLDSTQISDSGYYQRIIEWQFLVLASCMHAGTRVVRVTCKQQDQDPEWEIEVLAEFTEHESMNYASSVWAGSQGGSSSLLCVSSSFYDRRVCVWSVEV